MILVLSLCAGNVTFGLDSAGSYVYAKEGHNDQKHDGTHDEPENSKKPVETKVPTEVPTEAVTEAPTAEPTEAATEIPTEVPVEEPKEESMNASVEETKEAATATPTRLPEETERPEATATVKPTATVQPTVASAKQETAKADFYVWVKKSFLFFKWWQLEKVGTGTVVKGAFVCNNVTKASKNIVTAPGKGGTIKWRSIFKRIIGNYKVIGVYANEKEEPPMETEDLEPGVKVTEAPTATSTCVPTEVPTAVPTEVPTAVPTEAPTEEPTAVPTEVPTEAPTEEPTAIPTVEPTEEPTDEKQIPEADTVKARFYVLQLNLEQPEEVFSYPVKNYEYAGDGIVIKERVANDDAKVLAHIKQAPDVSKFETDGWTVRWYVIKEEGDGWHVDGIREKKKVPEETPSVITEPAVTATPVVTSPSVTATPVVTESAVTAIPVVTTPAVTATVAASTAPTAEPTETPKSSTKPVGPYGPVEPKNTNKPDADPTAKVVETGSPTSKPATKEDLSEVTPAPTNVVEITEDEISNGAPVGTISPSGDSKESAKPEASIRPTEGAKTVDDNKSTESEVPTQSVEPTQTTVSTSTPGNTIDMSSGDVPNIPNGPSVSQKECGTPITTPAETPDGEYITPDDITNSGVSTEPEEKEDTSNKTKKKEKDDVTITKENVPSSDVSVSPQTGDATENVFYIVGRMICALGLCVVLFKRRKLKR